ncbi:murein DD-endopeptidase MepM/ murein hydrolase activator NlpD [Leucobacter luti]|nr:murein DD-endopeptidase MepM/ murein hydrolase activator NlpD [Leucobacter luti]
MTAGSARNPDPRSYPSRRSVRAAGASVQAAPGFVLTQAPHFRPTEMLEDSPPRRRTLPNDLSLQRSQRAVHRTLAVAAVAGCACVLASAGLLPAAGPGEAAVAAAADAAPQELLLSGGGSALESALAPIDAVLEATPENQKELLAAGIDFRSLPDATTRYPFDSEVPLTDPFGARAAPVAGFHDAQDMDAGAGAEIRIVADGVISEAGVAADGCGFALKVQHRIDGTNVTSRYCHMQDSSHDWRVGDAVQQGDTAGRVGNTGMSFGAHLHLAMRQNDVPIDPLPFLAAHAK